MTKTEKQFTQNDKEHLILQGEITGIREDLTIIKNCIEKMSDNHLTHIQKDTNLIQTRITSLETNQNWLTKIVWGATSASMGALITGVINILMK